MKRNTIFEQGRSVALAACALLIGASVMQSCKDDDLILTGQPSWLGNSIYERLQEEGTYKYTLRLIDDLGETEVLSHTGSRTLFVAADSAYENWFKANDWGVGSYEQLTLPQKRLLLKNSMIDNAYLLELMSNEKAQSEAGLPEWGRTMRRTTATSYFDSVYVMTPEEMPDNIYWEPIKSRGKNIRILKDACAAPMIHFLPAYLQNHKITAEDLNLLTNGRATSINEAWVNGVKVVNSGDASRKKIDYDVTCKNGYIQKVEHVIESSPNMALIIHNPANGMMKWSHLLDRFSAPFFYQELSRQYNRDFNNNDSLMVLRYNSKSYYDWASQQKKTISSSSDKYQDPYGKNVDNLELLKFDPGWNQYIDNNSVNTLHNDAGMMIVPTDEAFDTWWNGEGKELQDEYLDIDNVPDNIIAELINVNMIPTFSTYVPSKFESVLNDAKEPLGITKADVAGCYMGCNGVIYKTKKVFTPALFSSVAYPALAHASTMNIIYKILDDRGFKPYLLSMDSKYALILPSNVALQSILDPATFGKSLSDGTEAPNAIELTYDTEKKQIKSQRYEATVDDFGDITKGGVKETNVDGTLLNKLYDDMMNQLTIIIPDKKKTLEQYVAEGYSFFKTKGGNLIKVSKLGSDLMFQGGWQMEHDVFIPTVGDPYEKKNGKSYQVDLQTPMGAQKSVYLNLVDEPQFSAFLKIMQNDYNDMLSERLDNNYVAGMASRANKNLRVLDNYNYTVYVPTNAAIQSLQTSGILPSNADLKVSESTVDVTRGTYDCPEMDSICKAEGWYGEKKLSATDSSKVRYKVRQALITILSDFVRYHVQDHSVAIGMAPEVNEDSTYRNSSNYESMKRNLSTGRFVGLNVDFDNNQMTITDAAGNKRHVVKTNGLYNIISREYWFVPKDKKNDLTPTRLFMASDVVMHQIDGALMYENLRPWRDIVKEALNNK